MDAGSGAGMTERSFAPAYAELQVTSNYSFLRGASHPDELVIAAKALGLSPPRQTFLIVLPQAIRNVIPAQIGQLISLFKDTALAGVAMGLFELLTVSQAITQQDDFRGQGLIGETLAFGALLFWAVSYTMSRESQRLEQRLGVGTR